MNKLIGRNDPCPCGSGKKYKKCCFLKIDEAETKDLEYSKFQNTRMSAKGKLLETAEFEMDISDSDVLSFLSDSPIYKNRDVDHFYHMAEHLVFFDITLNACKIFAYPIGNENVFLWQYCLNNFRSLFDTPEIKYLESIKNYIAGFFQIKDIDINTFITTFEDIFTKRVYQVKDKKLSQIGVRHDIFGGLLIPYNDIFVIEGPTPTIFTPDDKEYLRATVQQFYRMDKKRIRKTDHEELSRFLNISPIFIYRMPLDYFLFKHKEQDTADSKLLTKDRKEFILLKTYYKISNREEIKNKVLKLREFKIKEEGSEVDEIIWTNYRGISFGEVSIFDKEMIFLTDAREHLQKWKNLTKNMPLEFLNTEEVDQLEIMGKLIEDTEDNILGEKPENVSVEEFKEAAIKEWNIFYDIWFQQGEASLGYKSPAEALMNESGKQRVLDLIDGIENEILRTKKFLHGDVENKIKYFNADELRKRVNIKVL